MGFEGEPYQERKDPKLSGVPIFDEKTKMTQVGDQLLPFVFENPASRESDEGSFYQGVVVGLVVATLFWVIFMTVLWLILR